ncbi:MAG: phosphonate ABC transporter, permease protein PhnE [Myxococcota bacterium]
MKPHASWAGRVVGVLFIGYVLVALLGLDIDIDRIVRGLPRGLKFVGGFFPPDFVSRIDEIALGVRESLAMTVMSTVLGVALAVPFAIGSARNLAPRPVYVLCRTVVAAFRSLHEVILAVLFVAVVGFGPLAGVLTLIVASIGFFAKLWAEAIEDVAVPPTQALTATGAAPAVWFAWAVWPQVAPRFVGLALYRLDINFRESAIVGIVGGGGIGATLNTAFARYEYDDAAAIILVIIGIVLAVEVTSGRIREAIQ